jgi:hypothetical protein
MPWTPTKKVVDLTKIVDNLIAYIRENQTDAHIWAGDFMAGMAVTLNGEVVTVNGEPVTIGESGIDLDDYQRLYPNAAGRLGSIFPQFIVLNQEFTEDEGETEGGDILVSKLALTLEVAVTGPDADRLVLATKAHDLALRSMLKNIPSATLTGDSNQTIHGDCTALQTVFDVLSGTGGKRGSSFMQLFQVKVEYQLITAAF